MEKDMNMIVMTETPSMETDAMINVKLKLAPLVEVELQLQRAFALSYQLQKL